MGFKWRMDLFVIAYHQVTENSTKMPPFQTYFFILGQEISASQPVQARLVSVGEGLTVVFVNTS